jgi:hypothetical protein
LRLNLTVMIPNSGGIPIFGIITNVDDTTPGAFEYTVEPRYSTDPTDTVVITPNVTRIAWYGNVHGEGTGQPIGLVPLADSYTYNLQIIKETYSMTGSEAQTRVKWVNQSWSEVAGEQTAIDNHRMQEHLTYLVSPGTQSTLNAAFNGNLAQGMIPWILAGGVDVPYTAGSWSITDLHTMNETFDANRSSGKDYDAWLAFDLYSQWENEFQTTYNNGAIRYVDYQGKDAVSLKTGIKEVAIDDYTYRMHRMSIFTDPRSLGNADLPYSKYGMCIPAGMTVDALSGENVDAFELIYRKMSKDRKFKVWMDGANAPVPVGDLDVLNIYYLSEVGTHPKNALAFGIFTP